MNLFSPNLTPLYKSALYDTMTRVLPLDSVFNFKSVWCQFTRDSELFSIVLKACHQGIPIPVTHKYKSYPVLHFFTLNHHGLSPISPVAPSETFQHICCVSQCSRDPRSFNSDNEKKGSWSWWPSDKDPCCKSRCKCSTSVDKGN